MNHPDRCPACVQPELLKARSLEGIAAAARECARCEGVWIEREVIETLGRKAKADLLPFWVGVPLPDPVRPCPVCGAVMSRKASGVTELDVCMQHGVWFDRDELERFIGWVQERAERHLRIKSRGPALARSIPVSDREPFAWEQARSSGSGVESVFEILAAVL